MKISMTALKRACEAQRDAVEGMLIERAILQGAFNLVANPRDWRAPIKARVHQDTCDYDAEVISRAVSFFTGTTATIKTDGYFIDVQALGYRAGPAGDH